MIHSYTCGKIHTNVHTWELEWLEWFRVECGQSPKRLLTGLEHTNVHIYIHSSALTHIKQYSGELHVQT